MRWKLFCWFLILQIGQQFGWTKDYLPEVDTPLGKVRGYWKESIDKKNYAAFEGIPYAEPPIGDLRFEEPQPASPWTGIWDANNLHTCLQDGALHYDQLMEEDCLYLNVYVPAEFLNANQKLDIVVVIHGGAFMIGSGHMADARTMMDRNIILVTLNYRINIFGFLTTEDGVIPGNNGLKDQTLALKWVKDNIPSFGGNPDSVTITGLSAGGASVHFHYFSPRSKDLFHRGIAQSGSVLAPWAVRRNAGQRAKKLATLVGCPTNSTVDMKKCLKSRPAFNLLTHLKHFYPSEDLQMPFSPFAPVIEKQSPKAFLSKEPYLLLREGNVYDVPLIISFTADDGLMPSALFWNRLEYVNENWKDIARFVLDYNDTLPDPTKDHIVDTLSEYYLGAEEGINKKNFKKFTQMCTDRMFASPAELAAKMQAKVTKSPVYVYVFDYHESEHKAVYFYSQSDDLDGIAHGADYQYFYAFNVANEQEIRLKDACQDILYSFASTGVPSLDGTDSWQPTGSTELTYLNITGHDNMKLQTVENYTPLEFWANLGLRENEYFVHKEDQMNLHM